MGSTTQTRYVRDLGDSLKQAIHGKHKLGMSNQHSIYYQAWAKVLPHHVKICSDAFWHMPSISEPMKRNAVNYRNGQLYNKKLACMRKQAYLPWEGIARDSRCPLCSDEDSWGRVLGGCLHGDMKKQYIARHDKAMRAVVQTFTRSKHGIFYLIADVGREEGLKELGVHSKRVPSYVLPDEYLQKLGVDLLACRSLLQREEAGCRSKMRPDLMIVEMTTAEQKIYLQQDNRSGRNVHALFPQMPNGGPRRIWIVEGGYCSDTRYTDILQENKAQHQVLQAALRNYGYTVCVLPIILGFSGCHHNLSLDASSI